MHFHAKVYTLIHCELSISSALSFLWSFNRKHHKCGSSCSIWHTGCVYRLRPNFSQALNQKRKLPLSWWLFINTVLSLNVSEVWCLFQRVGYMLSFPLGVSYCSKSNKAHLKPSTHALIKFVENLSKTCTVQQAWEERKERLSLPLQI